MRQFICLVLVISLSWVTTGYACAMDGWSQVRSVCCCPGGHVQRPATSAEPCARTARADAGASCCKFVAGSVLDAQQPGLLASSPALDLPAFLPLPAATWAVAEPAARDLVLPPPARGPPGAGTHTFLTTARLRL
ncbi:MAG: hypothetical protein ACT4P0_03005 [Panacagrimonas sp.]